MKAFQLMKEGEKGQAGMIVKGVLREDPKNLNAWWMMSHIFDDEDKVVKSLEKVLQIDPDHAAARKRLAQLRPEYSNLVSDDTNSRKQSQKESVKADQDYWKKLDNPPVQQKKAGSNILGMLGNRFVLRLVLVVVFPGFAGISAMYNNFQSDRTIHDIHGNTPGDAIEAYYRADMMQDVDVVYELTCPEMHDYIDGTVAEYPDYYPATRVDLSRTEFDLYHHDYRNDRAYVQIGGEMEFDDELGTMIFDWDAEAAEDGYNSYGEFTRKVDGVWLVCLEYNVPDLEFERE